MEGVVMKIGFTCSAFDLLHAGHIQMLREAKTQCDYLVVGLQVDPSIDRKDKHKPIQSIVERFIQLSGVKYIDEIIPYTTEQDLENLLELYPIDVRIIGSEYKELNFTGKDICRKKGVEIYFNHRDHKFSSTELRKRILYKNH
jgi:glycerol-3-phosphate cytidylyltransferase